MDQIRERIMTATASQSTLTERLGAAIKVSQVLPKEQVSLGRTNPLALGVGSINDLLTMGNTKKVDEQ